jgi:hypothetical protein
MAVQLIHPLMVGRDSRYLGAESRTMVSVWEFGASPFNTAAQNFTAFQAALDAMAAQPRGGALFVPPYLYQSNGGLTINPDAADNITLVGVPGASVIDIRSGTFGFKAHMDFGRISIDGLSWVATNVSGFQRMIDIKSNDVMGATMEKFSITRAGTTSPFTGIWAEKLRESTWTDLDIQTGEAASYASSGIGIQLQGSGGAAGEGTEHVLTRVKVRSTGKAFVLRPTGTAATGGDLEGVHFLECLALGVDQGLDCQGIDDLANGYLAPLFVWSGGHINAKSYGLVFRNVAQAKAYGADIYIDSSGTEGAQAGILLDNVVRGNIESADISIIDQLGGGSLNDIVGISVSGASQKLRLRNNYFGLTGDSIGLLLGASTTKCRYGGNTFEKAIPGAGAVVSNLGTANADEGNNANIAA